jgi:hypothetical protein
VRVDRIDVRPKPGRDHVGEVDVDLVDAAVLDLWRERTHGGLEEPRILAVLVEVDGQQDGIGRFRRGLHHAHGRVHAERARFVGRGGYDAAARVVAEARVAALLRAGRGIGHPDRLVARAAPDDDRPAAQLRIAQQFDRRIERVHVEMGDHAGRFEHGGSSVRIAARGPRCPPRLRE